MCKSLAVAVLVAAGLCSQAAGQDVVLSKQDPYVLGETYAKAGKLLPAIRFFNAFISNSAGGGRQGAAKTALVKYWLAYVEQLADAGCFPEATREWVAMRDSLSIAASDPAATKARTKLETAYANAVKAQKFDLAMRVADSVAKFLPADPPLAPKEALDRVRVGALAASAKNVNLLDRTYAILQTMQKSPPPAELFAEFKVEPAKIHIAWADSLDQHGWTSRAIVLLQEAMKDMRDDDRSKCLAKIQDLLIKRAESCVAFGNLALAQQALAAAEAAELSDAAKAKLAKIKTGMEKITPAHKDPQQLKFEKAVMGTATWRDDGHGYFIQGQVTIGSFRERTVETVVRVEPGFVLEGGKIFVDSGQLQLMGTRTKPVIFRNVHIELNWNSKLVAQNAILENCKLVNYVYQGDFVWTKWTIKESLLLRPMISTLKVQHSEMDWADNAIVEANLPPKLGEFDRPEPGVDNMGHGRKNRLENCAFYMCDVWPSLVWMSTDCRFNSCQLAGREMHPLNKDVAVRTSVGPTDTPFMDSLRLCGQGLFQGELRVTPGGKSPREDGLKVLWNLANPVLTDPKPPVKPTTAPDKKPPAEKP